MKKNCPGCRRERIEEEDMLCTSCLVDWYDGKDLPFMKQDDYRDRGEEEGEKHE